jgi:hypothetical protein
MSADLRPNAPEAKPKRRWFRFSLRALLVLVTVLCVWLGVKVNVARRQKEAVAAILRAGGTVCYDCQFIPKSNPSGLPLLDYRFDRDAQSSAPAWLRFLIGDDCFRTVTAVYFNDPHPNITKADIDQIAKLPAVKQFVFGRIDHEWNVADSDFAALGQLDQLEVMELDGTRVTGTMLAQLHSLDKLTVVFISNADLDDVAMEQIGRMINLKCLWLGGTRITDNGIKQLQKLTTLKQLILNETSITDAGLKQLTQLNQLAELYLPYQSVSPRGVRELQISLPNATIRRSSNPYFPGSQ